MKKLAAAVASSLVLMSASHAAGLGKLTVLSALGQPLRAEIELTAGPGEDAAGVVAKLASPEAFKTANIDFNPALLSLRFNVEQRGGRQLIRVSSIQPLNEPFVDMLLELSWNNGRIVREYTFLLDPAELRSTQSAQVAPGEAPAASPRPRTEAAAPALPAADEAMRARGGRLRPAPEPARAQAQPAPDAAPAQRAGAGEYRVKAGDSLGRIAAQLKPVDVSLDMMLVALYRANPDAFMGNNMNRLKSGRVLAVPDADAIRATGDADAHGIVIAHAADFNAYRNKLAGQVATAEPVQTPPATQSAAGKVTAKVEERPTAANEAQDKLHLSKAAPAATAAGKGATSSTEDTIAQQKELEEARARIKELERNVGAVEKLVTLQNKAGAEAQQKAEAPKPDQKPAGAPEAPAKPVDVKPATKKLPAIKPAAKPEPAPEPGIFDFIMGNLPVVGGAAAIALLGGLLVAQRRKKKEAVPAGAPSILNVPTEPQHSLFAETGGQSVDTNNSVFNSSFAPSASQLDTNEVDPVAEADVYIAYGRDAQAEEILKEALRLHPERTPVRLKLLEIYAARRDLRAFETQAGELYAITRGQGDDWAQAAALGLSIDPGNPLYANGGQAVPALTPQEAGQQALLAREAALGAAATAAAAHEPLGFEQHFADALGAAQPAAQPSAPESAPAHEDEHLLDFDLGGLSFEPVTAEATAAPAAPHADPAATDVHEIDFDMSPFADPQATALPAAPASAPAAEPAHAGDLDDLAFDLDAFAPPATAPAAEPVPAPVPAAEASDFDFDLDAFAPPAPAPQPDAAPASGAAPAERAPLDFAFDMDFDAPSPAPAEAPAPAFTAEPLPGAADRGIDLAGLAREFDLDPPAPSATTPAPEPAAEPEDPLFDLDAMDFGLDAEPATPAAAAPQPAAPSPAPSLDDHLLDFAAPAPAVPEAGAAPNFSRQDQPAQHYDFGGFELDVPAGEEVAPLPDAAPAELSPEHMEMETKLDLALAYQEIGDKEGARELLEEVIKGGNDEQATRANALRAALA